MSKIKYHLDRYGYPVSAGTQVAFIAVGEREVSIGIVKSLTPKGIKLESGHTRQLNYVVSLGARDNRMNFDTFYDKYRKNVMGWEQIEAEQERQRQDWKDYIAQEYM